MKSVNITARGSSRYVHLCEFSEERYLKDLKLKITNYPDIFVYAMKGKDIVGCMGLNLTVKSPLFKEDLSLLRVLSTRNIDNYAEQSIFVVESNNPVCVPLLIATTAMYSHFIGINHLVYAGINVSCRTIEKLGFDTTKIGETSIDCLSPKMRENYRNWHEMHNPVTYLLDTNKAPQIFYDFFYRFRKKVICSYDFEAKGKIQGQKV